MQTHLYLHKENTDLPQSEYRGKYPLKHYDYSLNRTVGRKGEITSGYAEVKVKTVTISGNTTYTVRAGASGEASTGLTFKPSMGYSIENGMYLGFEVGFDGIILKVSGEAKYEEEKGGRETLSIGPELSRDFTLIDPKPEIVKREVYPFRKTNKK